MKFQSGSPKVTKLGTGKCLFSYESRLALLVVKRWEVWRLPSRAVSKVTPTTIQMYQAPKTMITGTKRV